MRLTLQVYLIVCFLYGCSSEQASKHAARSNEKSLCKIIFEKSDPGLMHKTGRDPGLYFFENNVPKKILTLSNIHEKSTVKVPEADKYLLVWHQYPKDGVLLPYQRASSDWHRFASELQLIINQINCPL